MRTIIEIGIVLAAALVMGTVCLCLEMVGVDPAGISSEATAVESPAEPPLAPPEPRTGVSHYVGVLPVEAVRKSRGAIAGYLVQFDDGFTGWMPEEFFERHYFRIGPTSEITEDTVNRFVTSVEVQQAGNRSVTATAHTRIGFDATRSATCAQTLAFDAKRGGKIAEARARAMVWEYLGFVHQWAERGVEQVTQRDPS